MRRTTLFLAALAATTLLTVARCAHADDWREAAPKIYATGYCEALDDHGEFGPHPFSDENYQKYQDCLAKAEKKGEDLAKAIDRATGVRP